MKKTNKIKNYSLKAARIGKKKKVKGFTLVELIVVIAIIGVLAVVLVPNMMKYVKNARLTKENDAAAKIADQANLIASDLEAQGNSLSGTYTASVTLKSGGSNTANHADVFTTALNNAIDIPDGTTLGIKFGTNGQVEAVVYKESDSDYVGLYPNPSGRDGSSDTAKDLDKAATAVGVSLTGGSSTETTTSKTD